MWSDRVRRTCSAGMAGVLLAVFGAGCSTSNADGKTKARLERVTISASCFPAPPCVPFQVALERGYFRDEGLDVRPAIVPTTNVSLAKFRKGEIDIAFDGTVQFLKTQEDGFNVSIVAENDLAPNGFLLLTTMDPNIRSVNDLKGKKIGIDQRRNFIELLATVSLAARNIDVRRDKVKFVPISNEQMPQALEKGTVDAAFLSDRFLNIMEAKGARRILDLVSGPTDRFPATSFAASQQFAQANPNTVAAFNRAIVRAQQTTQEDLNSYFDGLAKLLRIPRQAAAAVPPPPFVTSTNPVRLQRAADLMRQFGFMNQRVDIRTMIAPSIPLTSSNT
jgi:NitT/TauT family transport system substrate-binding protein